MSGLIPVAVYGLKVPAGDVMVPALIDFPATVSISIPSTCHEKLNHTMRNLSLKL